MARIIVADKAGACFGVERALEMARAAAQRQPGEAYTLGPLIHNPAVVSELESAGLGVASAPEDAQGAMLILRTHGVTPAEQERAQALCREVIDATCPFVARVHRRAAELSEEGYQVIVVGEAGHPEVEGIVGHAPNALVVGKASEVEACDLSSRVGIVVQTTQTARNLAEVVCAIVPRVHELRVINTICAATSERQEAAMKLAAQADLMLVLGGRNSANTRHLAEICSRICSSTHHIEDPEELEDDWFAGVDCVGITAGASTPQDQIEELCHRVEQRCG